MLRNLCLTTFAACLVFTGGLHADELSKGAGAPAIAVTSSAGSSTAPAQPTGDLYMLCAFYPKQGTCETVYQRALKDNNISAQAVRAEYAGYARYLTGSSPLTDTDRHYLKETGILMPSDLSAANQTGLHNVINDPKISADARRSAVNNFLSRAVQAELYCEFNSCQKSTSGTVSAGVWSVHEATNTANLNGG